jgi:hyaluronoglucosaminidase
VRPVNNYYTVSEWLDIKAIDTIEDLLIPITYIHQEGLQEAYRIRIQENQITITYDTKRSKQYADRTLSELLQKDRLYYGLIEDGPAFPMRGIIEGFYGEPWSHDDRKDVITFLDQQRMNTYMYAPKDDAYHRHKWREPYPEKDLNRLVELISLAQEISVDFYFCISPGNDFNYTNKDDFITLYQKIDTIISHGVSHFCLLLDDIDYQLQGNDLAEFQTPGRAHAYISNQLNAHLQSRLEQFTLVMCPTEYWQHTDSPYRQDLKEFLDANIAVFWTGYNTVAEYIPNQDGELAKRFFGHDLVLWDNYPVNDMATDMIFMGPLHNRGNQLDDTHIGFISNPMVEWALSKLPIMTMSDYMWNPQRYEPEVSYQQAIEMMGKEPQFIEALQIVLPNFRYSIIHYYKDEPIEQRVLAEDIDSLVSYYDRVVAAITILRTMPDERFVEQFEPWWKRLELDRHIAVLIQQENLDEAKQQIEESQAMNHTTGSQYALKYAKQIGLYDGPIYKKERKNYWR